MVALAMVTTFSTLNGNISANTLQKELHSGWRFKQARLSNWYPATVPGVVHTDLIDNKIIEDPFYRLNERGVQWVDKEDWIYETTFDVAPELMDKNNIRLYFKGLDTYADVYLNGEKILEADNMFREWKLPVKDKLKAKDNKLRIYFHSPIKRDMPKWDALPFQYEAINDQSENGGVFNRKVSVFARKAGYHYGWDWGPRLVTSCIWRPVLLEACDDLRIENVFIRQKEVSYKQADISNIVEILADKDIEKAEVTVRDNKTGKIYGATTTCLTKGLNKIAVNFFIKNPNLWWSNGLGKANLYEFRTEVKTNEQNKDCLITSTGIRSLKVIRKEDKEGRSFYFQLNGIPVFSKGANYIPCDNFLPRVTKELYEKTILDAVNANMNTLRVWGGGTYEDDYFYELCDKYGILVWQDFMFACSVYPSEGELLGNIRQEAIDNVRRLRNHPSLALWCGNNECLEAWFGWNWKENYVKQNPEYARIIWQQYEDLFHKMLPEVVTDNSPETFYWPSSPFSRYDGVSENNKGDTHYWAVWHAKKPISEYNKVRSRFFSEYGFQSFPEFESVKMYAPHPEDWEITSEVMMSHQRGGEFANKLIEDYLLNEYRKPKDFESFLYMNLVLQGDAIKTAIEAHRRDMPYCMGTLFWQHNDCWPVASWSSRDYYGRWKAQHYFAKAAFRDVLVSPIVNNDRLDVYIVSDRLRKTSAILELEVCDMEGKLVNSIRRSVTIPANESKVVMSHRLNSFIKSQPENQLVISATLTDQQGTIYTNNYFLTKQKEMLYPQVNISYQLKSLPDGYELTLKADRFARAVYLSLDGIDNFFEDNYFDLMPGKDKIVKVRTDISYTDFSRQLKIKSLVDGY